MDRAVYEQNLTLGCLGKDELFYAPDFEHETDEQQWYRDHKPEIEPLCAPCPVNDLCLLKGLADRNGFWGNTTPEERRTIRRANARA